MPINAETARSFYRRQGWNPGYGHKVKSLGRLVTVMVGGKELVDVEASQANYAATADPEKMHMAEVNERQRVAHRIKPAPKPVKPKPKQGPSKPQPTAPYVPPAELSKNVTYMQAKTAREVYEAKIKQLDYEELTGKMLPADQVKAHLAGKIVAMRDAFLQIPSRLVSVLAAETDPVKIHALLEDEISRAMALVSGEVSLGSA